jgi:hypothetical protein
MKTENTTQTQANTSKHKLKITEKGKRKEN